MVQRYSPEHDVLEAIRRLELEAAKIRRRADAGRKQDEREVRSGKAEELEDLINYLRSCLT